MSKNSDNPISQEVAAVFDTYPELAMKKLLFLRQLIFDTANSLEKVGEIEETLKWGEPSYLTLESKSGSTIRIAWKESHKDQYSIFFKCTANLVPEFKLKFPDKFNFGGNRSINFQLSDTVPVAALKQCIAIALTYHLNKNLDSSTRWEMVEKIT